MKFPARILAVLGLAFASQGFATSPNTTAANSVPFEVGQGWVSHYFDESTPTRWFRFGEISGHSYCVEAVQGSFSPIQLDPNVTIYTDATGATTLVSNSVTLTNDNGGGDPNYIKGSRICYISPVTTYGTTSVRGIKINVPITTGSGDSGYVRMRVVETTLYADDASVNWASSQVPQYWVYTTAWLTNPTPSTINYRYVFPLASIIGPMNSLPAGGSSNGQQVNYAIDPALTSLMWRGSVLIPSDGPLDALRGTFVINSLTTFTNGSFYTFLQQSQPLRSK